MFSGLTPAPYGTTDFTDSDAPWTPPGGKPTAPRGRPARPAGSLAGAVGVALSLCATLALPACGGGGHHHHEDPFTGTLEVEDSIASFDFIDEIEVEELGGPDHFLFDVDVIPGASFFVDLFPDTYDVTIFWGDGGVEFHTVDIFDGFTTTITVVN